MCCLFRASPKSGDELVARLFEAMEVVLDQERFLIQATRLPWFKRTPEEIEIAVGAAHSKVGPDLYSAEHINWVRGCRPGCHLKSSEQCCG